MQPSIWLRRLDGDPEFRMLPGTEQGYYPAFSPDNQWIVFRKGVQQNAVLAKVSVAGGGATTIDNGSSAFFPHWGTPDRIVFSGPAGVFVVPAEGGTPVKVPDATVVRPFLLPDGSGVLGVKDGNVVVHNLVSGKTELLVRTGHNPAYVPTGHLLYLAEDGGLFAVPFSLRGHRVTGPPRRVLNRVAYSNASRGYSVSDNGTLLHHEGTPLGGGTFSHNLMVVAPFSGKADTLPLPKGRRLWPRFSPNGRSLAYAFTTTRGNGEEDVYTFDLVTGTNTQLTFALNHLNPIWSPDGSRILYSRDSSDAPGRLVVQNADNSGAPQVLDSVARGHLPSDWPREDLVLFSGGTPAGNLDLFTMEPKPGAKARAYLEAPWIEEQMVLSPDGKLAAFATRETGSSDVWVRDFPVPVGKWRVSPNGGSSPRWSRDGKHVYFWRSTVSPQKDTLFRARIDRTPQPVVRAPEVMATLDAAGVTNWDLHPDGKRFVVIVPDAPATATPGGGATAPQSRYLVVVNWFTELKSAFLARRQ